jgi:hypothetical protein
MGQAHPYAKGDDHHNYQRGYSQNIPQNTLNQQQYNKPQVSKPYEFIPNPNYEKKPESNINVNQNQGFQFKPKFKGGNFYINL